MDGLHAHHRQRYERTVNSSRPTPQNPLSSRPGQTPDQHSTRLVLQSCLERLNRLDNRMHETIQEFRSFLMNLLDNYQSDITMEDSGGCDRTVDSQVVLDSPNAIPPFVFSHGHCLVPQPAPHRTSLGITGSLSEGTGSPQCKFAVYTAFSLNTHRVRASLLPHGAHSSVDHGPVVQPSLTEPQHSMYSEAFSAFRDPRATKLSSEGAGPHLGQHSQGQFGIFCSFSLERLQYITRLTAPWHVRFRL
jgi:hypothetical protein